MGSKTYTSHNVSRMMDDDQIHPMSKSVVLAYLRANDSASTKTSTRSLADYLAEGRQSTIIAKLKRAHRMSKANTYAIGEVKGSYQFKPTKERLNTQLVSTLDTILGFTPDIIYQEFGKANYYHIAKYTLQESYGYNPITNEVLNESDRIGKNVFLKDIIIELNQTTIDLSDQVQLVLQGPAATSGYTPFRLAMPRPHSQIQITSAVPDSKCTFVLCYADDLGNEVAYNITMEYFNYVSPNEAPVGSIDENTALEFNPDVIAPSVPAPTTDADYVMAYYTYTRNDKEYAEYFTYRTGTNLIAKLEGVTESVEKTGIYPPRLYARMRGTNYVKYSKDTAEYKAMTKFGKLLGIKWKDWVEEVHENMSGLRYVREIFLTFGLEANSNNKLIHQYLYHYFNTAYRGLPNEFISTYAGDTTTIGGFIGPYGNVPSSTVREELALPTGAKQGTTIHLKDLLHTSGIAFDSIAKQTLQGTITEVGKYTFKYANRVHTYYYQETKSTYTAISVYNLQSVDKMDGNRWLTSSGDSEDLIVPLDLAITAKLTSVELERLYAMAMQLVVNTYQKVKKKWYQKGIFKFVMFVVAVVITVFFPPAGVAALSAMAVVVGIGMAIAVSVVIRLLQKLVISLGLSSTVFQVIMVILAVVAAGYGGYLGYTNTTGMAGMTASNVMLVSNAAFAMANAGNQVALVKAMKQYQQSVLDLQARDQSLKEKVEALGLLQVPTPDVMIYLPPVSLEIKLGEEPEDYYEKSIHNVNVGTYVYDYIESYVDINTLLPDLNTLSINLENTRYVV